MSPDRLNPPPPTLYSDARQVHLLRGHAWRPALLLRQDVGHLLAKREGGRGHALKALMTSALKPLLIDRDPESPSVFQVHPNQHATS